MTPAELPLRDIHLPEPVGWWPPAPGWWILAGLVFVSAGLVLWRHRRRRTRLRRVALARLAEIEAAYASHGDVRRLASELSTLLRRSLITAHSRREVAGLTGEEWLACLDQGLEDRPFTRGPGRCLVEAPYRAADRAEVSDAVALLGVCRARLRNLGPGEAA